MGVNRLILTAWILLTGSVYSQSSWRIDRLTIADGLSEGYIYDIHQDKRGFIWIGTHGGLNRYDGYGFKVFQYMPYNSSSLGDNSVFFLEEDSTTGKFWIGGSSCLNEFDPEKFTNTRYRYTKKQLEFSDGTFINKNEILLACEYDVLLFNTQNKTFTRVPVYDENNQPVSIARVENTSRDRKGNFMIMSKTGIFFFDPATRTCKRKTAASPDLSPFYRHEVFNVLNDSRNYYWIATNKQGLIRYDAASKSLVTLPLPAPLKNESLRFDVVIEDASHNIWAGSTNGLFKIDATTMAAEYFSANNSKPGLLSHPEINVIREDRNHFMWIGTVGGGINKMIPENAGFKHLAVSRDKPGSTTGTYLMGLQQVGNDMWFLNIWDQVGKVNLQTGRVTILSKPELPASYSWYSEGTIMQDANNRPVVFNGENAYQVKQTREDKFDITTHPATGLYYVYNAKNNRRYYMVKAAVTATFCRNDTIFGNQFFYDAAEDSTGNIWIGTSRGLVQLKTSTNEVRQYQHDDKNTNSISSDFIYSLETDNDQNIWMAAYHGGLCSYNTRSHTFRHYNKEDGLADNIVYSLEKDNHGNLWFSTNSGISSYHVANKTFRNYGKSDGLLNNEFNRRSSYRNAEGWIFFGGIFGIDYFHPDSIIKNNITPHLAFTNFRIFNHDYVSANTVGTPLIELKYGDRYISIEFAALDYNDQDKIQYAYRLDDNPEWIRLGNQHVLSFSELSTGQHRLFIRSTNGEGAWLNNEISCNIIIHPAWWQTNWFRLLTAALITAVIVLTIRSYFRRKLQKQRIVLEKEQAIEKERTRIATDMHDDLGSGLSRIRYLGETIRLKTQQQQNILPDIEKISGFSDEMVDKMNEIIWALNEKNDSLEALISYTRSFAVDYLSNNDLQFTVRVPDQIPVHIINGETRRNIFLAVKESLHNIVKHAHATSASVIIDVNHRLTIDIHDNGKGINWNAMRPFSNGISNIQKRMKDVNGSVAYSNEAGTRVIFSIPVL